MTNPKHQFYVVVVSGESAKTKLYRSGLGRKTGYLHCARFFYTKEEAETEAKKWAKGRVEPVT
jgi:hypothetical protein